MDHLRCVRCQDIIGVYEPMRVILGDGRVRAGSRLTLGSELQGTESLVFHEHCHLAAAAGSARSYGEM